MNLVISLLIPIFRFIAAERLFGNKQAIWTGVLFLSMSAIHMPENQKREVFISTTRTIDGISMNFGGEDVFVTEGNEHYLSGPGDETDGYYYQKYQAFA
jgi:hypothetical protein